MKEIILDRNHTEEFYNHVDFCIGTGRMGLALQKEYMAQLKYVQDRIGFTHIRGHGLFADDMAIYHEYQDENGVTKAEYNFTYLDLVMDSYRELHIKPFLELGFMPGDLAGGTQTVFYWKGNVTPPKDENRWCELVQVTLLHLMERYGAEEVVTWPVEVWNEPNLEGFWENADMEKYFHLFEITIHAVKEVDPRFKVGGPAICGVDDERWIREFMKFCSGRQLPVDFITRHHYTTEMPENKGHYGYQKLSDPEFGFRNLKSTRDIVDEFEEYRGKEIHLTEFNTSYIPNNPIHDTNLNAAYIAHQLSRLGDHHASYSYWTFGDIFEEFGVPFTPFHGGFGLVANGCIPKPTFYTFRFFKHLTGRCIYRSEQALVMVDDRGDYRGILWNPVYGDKKGKKELSFRFPAKNKEQYSLIRRTVDEDTCNPLKVWHVMGEPASLTKEQKDLLKEAAQPLVTAQNLTAAEEWITCSFTLKENAVEYFELKRMIMKSDRGYVYEQINRMGSK